MEHEEGAWILGFVAGLHAPLTASLRILGGDLMAFTDNCSLFGALDEEGINLVVRHVMRQRPSLFNYATRFIKDRPHLLCARIDPHPWVIARSNPLVTLESPLPILGTDGSVGLNFCFQITRAEIDLHPGGVVNLPAELTPPLKEQHFAFHVRICGGLGCPSGRLIFDFADIQIDSPKERFPTHREGARDPHERPPHEQPPPHDREDTPKPPPKAFPTDKLECFCLDVFATAHVEIDSSTGQQRLVGKLDGLEIVDIEPKGLETSIECYLKVLIQIVILPRLSVALKKIVFEILDGLATVTLKPTPVSAAVPHNPAIEQNKLKVFIDMEVQ